MSPRLPRGFTLIELLIVVVIIGVLAAIALPKFATTRQQATRTDGISDMRNLATAQEAFFSDSSRYATLADTGTGPGKLNFAHSSTNTGLTLVATSSGWSGVITVPGNQKCGIFSGSASRPAGMPASTQAGTAVCW